VTSTIPAIVEFSRDQSISENTYATLASIGTGERWYVSVSSNGVPQVIDSKSNVVTTVVSPLVLTHQEPATFASTNPAAVFNTTEMQRQIETIKDLAPKHPEAIADYTNYWATAVNWNRALTDYRIALDNYKQAAQQKAPSYEEGVRLDVENKVVMTAHITNYVTYVSLTTEWLNKEIATARQNLANAQQMAQDEINSMDESINSLDSSIQTAQGTQSQLEANRDAAQAAGNQGLADYYDGLAQQNQQNIQQLNNSRSDAAQYRSDVANGTLNNEPSIYIYYGGQILNVYQNASANFNARSTAEYNRNWHDDPSSANSEYNRQKKLINEARVEVARLNAECAAKIREVAARGAEYYRQIAAQAAANVAAIQREVANLTAPASNGPGVAYAQNQLGEVAEGANEWYAEYTAWINQNIQNSQQDVQDAQTAYDTEVTETANNVTSLNNQLTTLNQQSQNYQQLRDNAQAAGNTGLVDYYNGLLTSTQTEITQTQASLTSAQQRQTDLANHSSTIDVCYNLSQAQSGLQNWQTRLAGLDQPQNWNDPTAANNAYSADQLDAANARVSDANNGVTYSSQMTSFANNSVTYAQSQMTQAQQGLQNLQSEANTLNASASTQWSVAWTQQQYNDAVTYNQALVTELNHLNADANTQWSVAWIQQEYNNAQQNGTDADRAYWTTTLNTAQARQTQLTADPGIQNVNYWNVRYTDAAARQTYLNNSGINSAQNYYNTTVQDYNNAVTYQSGVQQQSQQAQTYQQMTLSEVGGTGLTRVQADIANRQQTVDQISWSLANPNAPSFSIAWMQQQASSAQSQANTLQTQDIPLYQNLLQQAQNMGDTAAATRYQGMIDEANAYLQELNNGVTYWTTRANASQGRLDQLSGDNGLLAQAEAYAAQTAAQYQTALNHLADAKNAVSEAASSLASANRVAAGWKDDKSGVTYVDREDYTIQNDITNLENFTPAREDLADFHADLNAAWATLERSRAEILKTERTLLENSLKLKNKPYFNGRHDLKYAFFFNEKQLQEIREYRAPQDDIGSRLFNCFMKEKVHTVTDDPDSDTMWVRQNSLATDVSIAELARYLGFSVSDAGKILNFKFDVCSYRGGLQNGKYFDGIAVGLNTSCEIGDNTTFNNYLRASDVNRTGTREIEHTGATNGVVYQATQQKRWLLFDNLSFTHDGPAGKLTGGLLGYMDVVYDSKFTGTPKDSAGIPHADAAPSYSLEQNGRITGWQAYLRDDFKNGLFVTFKCGQYDSEADEDMMLLSSYGTNGLPRYQSGNISVRERYLYNQLGTGYKFYKDNELELFVRQEKDDTEWLQQGGEYVMGGASIKGSISRFDYKIEGMGGDTTKARGFIRFNIPDWWLVRDWKLQVSGQYKEKYDYRSAGANLIIPVSEGTSLNLGYENSVFMGRSPQDTYNVSFGLPGFGKDKEDLFARADKLEGMPIATNTVIYQVLGGSFVPFRNIPVTTPVMDKGLTELMNDPIRQDITELVFVNNGTTNRVRCVIYYQDAARGQERDYRNGQIGRNVATAATVKLPTDYWKKANVLMHMSYAQLRAAGIQTEGARLYQIDRKGARQYIENVAELNVAEQQKTFVAEPEYTLNGNKVQYDRLSQEEKDKVTVASGARYFVVANGVRVPLNYYVDATGKEVIIPGAEKAMFYSASDGLFKVAASAEAQESGLRDLTSVGPVYDGGERKDLTPAQIKDALAKGCIYPEPVVTDGQTNLMFRIRGYNNGNTRVKNGTLEPGQAAYDLLNSIGRNNVSFLDPSSGALRAYSESNLVANATNLNMISMVDTNDGLRKLAIPDFDGIYDADMGDLLYKGKPYRAISLSDEMLHRELASREGRLWLKDNKFVLAAKPEDVVNGAERVVGFIYLMDTENGYLQTPITASRMYQGISEGGFNGHHLSAEQSKDEQGRYLWFLDKNDNGRYDKGIDQEAWKPYPGVKSQIKPEHMKEAKKDLLNGWEPVYTIGFHSNFGELDLNALGQDVLSKIHQDHLVAIDRNNAATYIPSSNISNEFPRLYQMYTNGCRIVQFDGKGGVAARYYFGKNLTDSTVVRIEADGKAHVYSLDANGKRAKHQGISVKKNIITITEVGEPVRIYDNPPPVGTIGVDAFGDTIFNKYGNKGALNMGQNFGQAIAMDSALSGLTNKVPTNAPVVMLYDLKGWSTNDITSRHMGWTANLGAKTWNLDAKHRISFELNFEISNSGKIRRIFGIESETKKEKVQFFVRPQQVNGTKAEGIVVVDVDESTKDLPDQLKKPFKGNEKVRRI
jgi:hypothetical protein